MWAEMATNYYTNANAPSLFVNLFSTDSGYIPLPQRLIAYLGSAINISDIFIPYYYTWSGILITSCMVGTFCLAPFRELVKSDCLRFISSLAVLLVADFETRTFINFTYFAAFFIAIVTALAMVQKDTDCPQWAWVIPILIISKPAVLAALPAMFLAALVSKTRFKLITLSAAVLSIFQLLSIYLNHSETPFNPVSHFSSLEKITAAGKYSIGFLSAFSLGRVISFDASKHLWIGALMLLGCLVSISKKRVNAAALLIVGLSLLFSNTLLNTFALSDSWNINNVGLVGTAPYRHILVGYFGVVLVITGLIETYAHHKSSSKQGMWRVQAPSMFLIWFVLSGWIFYSWKIGRQPVSPVLYNSQWQEQASSIKSAEALCIPIDPFGWVYKKNCWQLNPEMSWAKTIEYRPLSRHGEYFTITLESPATGEYKNLISIAVLVKAPVSDLDVKGELVLKMKDGSFNSSEGNHLLHRAGGLIMFTPEKTVPLEAIESVTLKFHSLVNIGFVSHEPVNNPAVIWMGN
jgi:hypothetical protein